MRVVMSHPGVVAAHHARSAADASCHDSVVQGTEGLTQAATQHIRNIFMRETCHQMVLIVGDKNLAPLGIIIDSHAENRLGDFHRFVLMELDVGSTLNFRLGGGGDYLGVIVLGNFNQTLHDALDIYNHSVYSAGENG